MTGFPWGSLHSEMVAAAGGRPTDVAGVVDQLVEIQRVADRLPTPSGENPVADFNNLYLTLAMRVLRDAREGRFTDGVFLDVLHVEFVTRYLDTLRAWGTDGAVPEAWTVLLRYCGAHELPALPFAAAGANALLNYDLPLALVATWGRLGPMCRGSVQHDDYVRLDEIICHTMSQLCAAYAATRLQHDERFPPRCDEVDHWLLLQLTRGLAWQRAAQLWRVTGDPLAFEDVRCGLDDITAVTGRALLHPFGSPVA